MQKCSLRNTTQVCKTFLKEHSQNGKSLNWLDLHARLPSKVSIGSAQNHAWGEDRIIPELGIQEQRTICLRALGEWDAAALPHVEIAFVIVDDFYDLSLAVAKTAEALVV